ncbi:hypothetical protein [Halovivax gelatinilyticus]|uniref:hypothetical protein n=1 Tax=Halovivax gelatinilyticus TaxID=2961597 RepID=UPI0020CA2A77|nr:hypothetical protein [Halovivax gelatinilyticus]
MQRRKILQSIGSASIGIGSVNSASAETSADDTSDVTVESFDGHTRQRVLTDAFSDDAFQKIESHNESRGWQILEDQIEARRVTNTESGGFYDLIVADAERTIPGRQIVADEEMVVIWIGNDTVGLDLPQNTVAHHVRKIPTPNNERRKRATGLFGWDEISVITCDDGTISVRDREFRDDAIATDSTDLGSNSTDPIEGPGDGGDGCCRVDVEIGSDAKWGCTALAIATAGFAGLGCSACIFDPSRITCGSCLIGAGLAGISTVHCFSSTVTVQEDVEQSWLLEQDFNCSDFSVANDDSMRVSEGFFNEELPRC